MCHANTVNLYLQGVPFTETEPQEMAVKNGANRED